MSGSGHSFRVLAGTYAVCRLPPGSAPPAWAKGEFVSLTATVAELSIVCAADQVPPGIQADREWRLLQVLGPFSFSTVGVLAALTAPLAAHGLSVLAIATYDTDYLLVKEQALIAALAALAAAGHSRVD